MDIRPTFGSTPAPDEGVGATAARRGSLSDAGPVVVPLIEEAYTVDTHRVDRGGFRIDKRVTSRDETVDVALRSLDVTIERRPVDRLLPSLEAPAPRQEGDTWILPVVEEVLVTEKRLRIKEEIRITRVDRMRHEPQQVSLRQEHVSIERLEPGHPLDIASSSPPRP